MDNTEAVTTQPTASSVGGRQGGSAQGLCSRLERYVKNPRCASFTGLMLASEALSGLWMLPSTPSCGVIAGVSGGACLLGTEMHLVASLLAKLGVCGGSSGSEESANEKPPLLSEQKAGLSGPAR